MVGLDLLAAYIPWILGGCLIALLLTLVVTVHAYIQSRRAPFYYLREQARARSARAVWVILLLLALMLGGILIANSR